MEKSQVLKPILDNIGRAFNLLFNRTILYHRGHPATVQALEGFLKTVTEGLNFLSPLALAINQDKLFLEEDPLDLRINTSKMLAHFKKAAVQSVSFEQGMSENEVRGFMEIFTDLKTYPTAESMKAAFPKMGITHFKLNHVFFQKVTEDEKVVSREDLKEDFPGQLTPTPGISSEGFKEILIEKLLLEELDKSFSLQSLIGDPTLFSNTLINTDLSRSPGDAGKGFILSHQLQRLKVEVQKNEPGAEEVDLSKLADAVFTMKKDLFEGIEAQKALGVVFANEEVIRKEADALTDQVIIHLVKEEYKQGEISIPRLAQLIRRIIPEPGAIKRLLPLLKEALLAEGMSLVDFLRLVQELGKELETEELVHVIKESAAKIGLSGEELIKEIKRDPTGTAELIFLAAEIRRGTGDEKVFGDLLANYVEQIGSALALDTAEQKGEEGGKHLKKIISQVESELVTRLSGKLDHNALTLLEKKLNDHLDEVLKQLKSTWVLRKISSPTEVSLDIATLLKVIEKSVEDEKESQVILEGVVSSLRDQGVEEAKLKPILEEISKRRSDQNKKTEKWALPKGTFNRGNMLFFLKKEIARAWRYKVSFSTIIFSIVDIVPKTPASPETIKREEVCFGVMERLAKKMRETDLIGLLDESKIFVLLPMANESSAYLALQRLLELFRAEPFLVKNIPLEITFATVTTSFHQDKTPNLQAFLKEITTGINESMETIKFDSDQKNLEI